MKNDLKILVRGAGDIASGIIWSLAYAGFNVCCTEVEKPSTIRTEVAFSTEKKKKKKILDGVRIARPYKWACIARPCKGARIVRPYKETQIVLTIS